jgi:hypothetical protein
MTNSNDFLLLDNKRPVVDPPVDWKSFFHERFWPFPSEGGVGTLLFLKQELSNFIPH